MSYISDNLNVTDTLIDITKNENIFNSVIRRRKKIISMSLAVVLSLLSIIFAAPSTQAKAKVSKSEYQSYVNSLRKLASAENSITRKWDSVTGNNYTDDETQYEVVYDLLPEVTRFIARIEKIQPKNSTLRSIHKIYIYSWNLQLEGMTLQLQALTEQNFAIAAQANKALSQGRSKMSDYIAKMKALGY